MYMRRVRGPLPDPAHIIHCIWEGRTDAMSKLKAKYMQQHPPAKPTHAIAFWLEGRALTLVCAFESVEHVRLELDYGTEGHPECTLLIEDTSGNPDVEAIVRAGEAASKAKVWHCVSLETQELLFPAEAGQQFKEWLDAP